MKIATFLMAAVAAVATATVVVGVVGIASAPVSYADNYRGSQGAGCGSR
jgi:hypothetical protein